VEAPPCRPPDDGLDPPRRVACHYRTPQCPRPRRRIEKQAGRSPTATTTCTGSSSPPTSSASPRRGSSMLPAPPSLGRTARASPGVARRSPRSRPDPVARKNRARDDPVVGCGPPARLWGPERWRRRT
jgi:hypothetical protein